MNNEEIERKIHEVLSEHLDRDNVGRLKTELANLCARVDTEARQTQRETDAEKCESIGSECSPVGFGRKIANECAASIRNGEQP